MVSTRRSQGSMQNSPASVNKNNSKRFSDTNSSPIAKRGKTESGLMTVEETMDAIVQKAKEDAIAGLKSAMGNEKAVETYFVAKDKSQTEQHDNGQEGRANKEGGREGVDVEIGTVEIVYSVTKKNGIGHMGGDEDEDDVANGHTGQRLSTRDDAATEAESGSNPYEDEDGMVQENDHCETVEYADGNKETGSDGSSAYEGVVGANGSSVGKREHTTSLSSTIYEKGIIYLCFQNRVDIERSPECEVEQSYIVLRPLPEGAKLEEGLSATPTRLLALSKKSLPAGDKDRFFVVVDKAHEPFDIVKTFVQSKDFPAATPVATGIYAISHNTVDAHLSYHIASHQTDMQSQYGIKQEGNFAVFAQNPTNPSSRTPFPDQVALYPSDLVRHFSGLRWMPLIPELLGYDNTQILIIGDCADNVIGDVEDDEEDKNLLEFEHEDWIRVTHLKADDAIYAELALLCEEFSKILALW